MRRLVKAAVGITLLGVLYYFGQLDFAALAMLKETPSALLISFCLVFSTVPLGAWRWSILLRTFRLSLPFKDAYHVTAIGALGNLFLLGSAGGDAIRMICARRNLGLGTGRIALSLLADRAFGFIALLVMAAGSAVLNWPQFQQVSGLKLLVLLVLIACAAALVAGLTLTVVPALLRELGARCSRLPRVSKIIGQILDLVMMAHENPMALLKAFALALAIQSGTLCAVVVIAQAQRIGSLDVTEYLFATSLTLIANSLPLTPNGLGVGEFAFDQICRWIEPQRSGAAYSSIFFAFRAIGVLVSLTGLSSVAVYRKISHRIATQSKLSNT